MTFQGSISIEELFEGSLTIETKFEAELISKE